MISGADAGAGSRGGGVGQKVLHQDRDLGVSGAVFHLEALGPGGVDPQNHPPSAGCGSPGPGCPRQGDGGGLEGAGVEGGEEQGHAQAPQHEAGGEEGRQVSFRRRVSVSRAATAMARMVERGDELGGGVSR